jgi:hypothetical protein
VVAALAVATGAVSPAAGASAPVRRSASSDRGGIGVRLVDIPASLANDPRARQYIIDDLKPGTTVKRRIEVANSSASKWRVNLYPGAANITHGTFVGAIGAKETELTTWTKLDRKRLDIPAHSVIRDTVTIAVPKDAAPGERYGAVWAQVSSGHKAGSVALVSRAGIRIYLSVSGQNPPAAKFTVNTMTAERDRDGRPIVHAQIHNTGGRALDLRGTLKLSAVSGSVNAGPYDVQLGTTLAPGQSEPVTAPVTDEVADGPWDATLELKSGLLDETYRARITFPHEPGIAGAVAAHPISSGSSSLLISALLALVTLLSAALLITTRHRRRGKNREPELQPDTPEPTTTNSL